MSPSLQKKKSPTTFRLFHRSRTFHTTIHQQMVVTRSCDIKVFFFFPVTIQKTVFFKHFVNFTRLRNLLAHAQPPLDRTLSNTPTRSFSFSSGPCILG